MNFNLGFYATTHNKSSKADIFKVYDEIKDENMKINRFMIAAPKSGSGKTMITCALLQLLKDSGKTYCHISADLIILTRCFTKGAWRTVQKSRYVFYGRKDNSAAFLR